MDSNQNGSQPPKQLSWSQPSSTNAQAQKPMQSNQSHISNTKPSAAQSGISGSVIWGFIAGIIIGLLIGWAWFGLRPGVPSNGAATTTESGETTTAGNTNSNSTSSETQKPAGVTASDVTLAVPKIQPAGMTVEVSAVSAGAPVWAVVYENENGAPGWALGAKKFMPEETSGTITLLRATTAEKSYLVGLTTDIAGAAFDIHVNAPLTDESGNAILAEFTAE